MISERLKKVVLKTLKLDDFDIQDHTIAPQVPGWDSLAHVQVLAAVEREFGIRFTTTEVIRLANVGELQRLVDKKTAATANG